MYLVTTSSCTQISDWCGNRTRDFRRGLQRDIYLFQFIITTLEIVNESRTTYITIYENQVYMCNFRELFQNVDADFYESFSDVPIKFNFIYVRLMPKFCPFN